MKRMLGVAFVFASLVFACAGSDGNSNPTDTTDQQGEDLTGRKCGTWLGGECPSGYTCDMSDVPAGNVGGSGVCRKHKACVLNGVFMCPKGESFDTGTCKCEKDQ
jgi:hypothetical protein